MTALREHAKKNDEPLSDVLRRAVLLLIGICPTCGHKIEPKADA